jgi:hypothetical protein
MSRTSQQCRRPSRRLAMGIRACRPLPAACPTAHPYWGATLGCKFALTAPEPPRLLPTRHHWARRIYRGLALGAKVVLCRFSCYSGGSVSTGGVMFRVHRVRSNLPGALDLLGERLRLTIGCHP